MSIEIAEPNCPDCHGTGVRVEKDSCGYPHKFKCGCIRELSDDDIALLKSFMPEGGK